MPNKPIHHPASYESTSNAASYTDLAAAYLDLDAGGTFAQVGAKGPGSIGTKIRTVLAGVALTVATFTSAGVATFLENVNMSSGKTFAAQAITATTIAATAGITQTGNGLQISNTGSGVVEKYIRWSNTTGDAFIGLNGTNGGALFTGGSTNALQLGTNSATALELGTSDVIRLAVSSAGAFDFKSNPLSGVTTATLSQYISFSGTQNLAAAGQIGLQAGTGLTLWSKTGSSFDFNLYNAAGTVNVMSVATGTSNVAFGGTITISGIDNNVTAGKWTVTRTSTQGSFNYDASNRFEITTGSTGIVAFNAVGAGASFTFAQSVTVSSGTAAVQALTAAVGITSSADRSFFASGAGGSWQWGCESVSSGNWYLTRTGIGHPIIADRTTMAVTFGASISATVHTATTGFGFGLTAVYPLDLKQNLNAGARMQNLNDTDATTSTNTMLYFIRNGANVGSITTTLIGVTAYNTSSDERLKNDLGVATTCDVLRRLVIHDFTRKADKLARTRERSVFAQEAYSVAPYAIHVGGDDAQVAPWCVDNSKFVPDLIVGWQNHESRFAKHESRFDTIESRLTQLEQRVA